MKLTALGAAQVESTLRALARERFTASTPDTIAQMRAVLVGAGTVALHLGIPLETLDIWLADERQAVQRDKMGDAH